MVIIIHHNLFVRMPCKTELQKITTSFIWDLGKHLFKRWNQKGRREHFWHSCSETSAANRKETSSSSHKKKKKMHP